jgi:hypothetical protein
VVSSSGPPPLLITFIENVSYYEWKLDPPPKSPRLNLTPAPPNAKLARC